MKPTTKRVETTQHHQLKHQQELDVAKSPESPPRALRAQKSTILGTRDGAINSHKLKLEASGNIF